MELRIQLVIGIIILLGLLGTVNLVRKNKLELKYSLSWIFLELVMLIIDIFPNIMMWFAKLFGFELQSNMMFFLGLAFSIIIIFILTLTLSRMAYRVRKLTQEVALLEKRLDERLDKIENK